MQKTLDFINSVLYNNIVTFAGVMELADVVDSKSTGSDTVPVRVRPPAPKILILKNGDFYFLPLHSSPKNAFVTLEVIVKS